ncbi:Protein kinase domain [Phytophthora infestans]|uniref:Protein kinase domain n=1 Tax=Phytophthora infestans TaxID=4787 RepID=A0A8S9UTH6_PHYIN|nr:Protein kinase domain [Phytophthora infestans]
MARSNTDIALMKKSFQEKYGEDLVGVLSSNLSGNLKKVIQTAMRGEVVDFNMSVHTREKATTDADNLYKTGEGRGADRKKLIDILVLSPAEHVRYINRVYKAKYKADLIHVINAKFGGDAKSALLLRVRSILDPMDLLVELFETTLRSVGKNNKLCCQPSGRLRYNLSVLVVRYFHLLERIGNTYRKLYRQDIRTRIRSVAKGEYCQLLLSVLDAAAKTAVCPSCTAASDPKEDWCRYCGASIQGSTEKKAERNSFIRYLKTHSGAEAWRKTHEVATALQDLHEQGIVQGNLKPRNLTIGRDGKGHLLELESCKRVEEQTRFSVESQNEELRWQAPECLNGGQASLASDIYSLAMCIVYVASGKPPWGSNVSDIQIHQEVSSQHATLPRPHGMSDNEWNLLKRMCEYEPSKKISIGDVVQALSRLSSGRGICQNI